MLRAADGRPRLSVVYTAHLSDEERLFVTALLLDKVKTWMRRQGGTSELRALVYMDEIFGYFPPHPANPPTKRPLLTLLKQARAQGVGVVLATQNPVDLDYKGLANMGTWMVGTLQTQQDRERLRGGLGGAGLEASAVDSLLAATKKRVFLLHDVHRKAPGLLQSRWAMSYLRGPLTRDEIARLTKAKRPPAASARGLGPRRRSRPRRPRKARRSFPPPSSTSTCRSTRPRWPRRTCSSSTPCATRTRGRRSACAPGRWRGRAPAEALEAEPIAVDEAAIAGPRRRRACATRDLPAWLAAGGARRSRRRSGTGCRTSSPPRVYRDPVTNEACRAAGETREAFAARLCRRGGGGDAAESCARSSTRRGPSSRARAGGLGRKQEKWFALGCAVLKNIGLFTGRKRTITGVGSVLTKNRMEDTAEARLEALRTEVADLERQQAAEMASVDPARLAKRRWCPRAAVSSCCATISSGSTELHARAVSLHLADGTQYGPVDRATLEAWHREGRLPEDTLVWPEGAPEWLTLGGRARRPRRRRAQPAGPRVLRRCPRRRRCRRPRPAAPTAHAAAARHPPRRAPARASRAAPASGRPGHAAAHAAVRGLRASRGRPCRGSPSLRGPAHAPARRGRRGAGAGAGRGPVGASCALRSRSGGPWPTCSATRSPTAACRTPRSGLTLDLPAGWVALPEDNPLVVTRGARLRVAHPASRRSARSAVEVRPQFVDGSTPYLDLLLQERLPSQPSLKETQRGEVQLGRGRGRIVRTTWEDGGLAQQGATVAWADGYDLFSLEVWAPLSAGDAFRTEVEALVRRDRRLRPPLRAPGRGGRAPERWRCRNFRADALRLLVAERMSRGAGLEDVPQASLRMVSRGLDALDAGGGPRDARHLRSRCGRRCRSASGSASPGS